MNKPLNWDSIIGLLMALNYVLINNHRHHLCPIQKRNIKKLVTSISDYLQSIRAHVLDLSVRVASNQRCLLRCCQLFRVFHLSGVLGHGRVLGLFGNPLKAFRSSILERKFPKINASFICHYLKSLLLNSLDSSGADTKLDPSLTLRPVNLLILQVDVLKLLVTFMGEGYDISIVCLLSSEVANARSCKK